jgi:hypothetical protein
MYSVDFDWGDSRIYRDENGEFKTLAAAKKDLTRSLKSQVLDIKLKLKELKAMTEADVENDLRY